MAAHKLQIVYDAATGDLTITHRCTVEVGGHTVSHAEPVTVADPAAFAASLNALIDANRGEMEQRANELAIDHAAAVAGKARKGRKAVALGGTLGAVGGITTKG